MRSSATVGGHCDLRTYAPCSWPSWRSGILAELGWGEIAGVTADLRKDKQRAVEVKGSLVES